MTLIERCGCGASIEVSYDDPQTTGRTGGRTDALDAVNTWRELHAACATPLKVVAA